MKWLQHSLEEIAIARNFERVGSRRLHRSGQTKSGVALLFTRGRLRSTHDQPKVQVGRSLMDPAAGNCGGSSPVRHNRQGLLIPIADKPPIIEPGSLPTALTAPCHHLRFHPMRYGIGNRELYPCSWFQLRYGVLHTLYASLRAKPFAILPGIPGPVSRGWPVSSQEAVGANTSNGQFRMIPVRPDWNDSSDLLGYFDLNGDFRPGQLISTLLLAHEQPDKPFFVCLDEMNLARVEHYFSDFLSVLESRRKENGQFVTDAVLREEQIVRMMSGPSCAMRRRTQQAQVAPSSAGHSSEPVHRGDGEHGRDDAAVQPESP